MSDIRPIISQLPASAVGHDAKASRAGASSAAAPARGRDRVELSPAAQMLSKLKGLPPVREDLINRVRAEIANGTYETPEKIDALLESENLASDIL